MSMNKWREHKFVMGCNDERSRRLACAHERRARLAGVEWKMIDLGVLYRSSNGMCGICSNPVAFDEFTVDHIRPLSFGGPHTIGNLQIAHHSCNSRKGNSY